MSQKLSSPSRLRSTNLGQGLVEFAIILPVLAIVLLSIIQFAFIFAAQIGVTNAVREAARTAAVAPVVNDSAAAAIAQNVYLRLINPTDGLLKKNVFAFNSANVVTSGTADTQVCYREEPAAVAGEFTVFVKVEGGYRHPLFIPLLSGLLDGIDGVTDGGLRVGTSEEMRVENQVLLASPSVAECYNP